MTVDPWLYVESHAECKDTRARWERGACPCCGINLHTWCDDDHACRTIGEGVRICGDCARRGHDDEDVAPLLLRMLVCRDASH